MSKRNLKFIHLSDTHLGLNWPAIGRREKIQISVYGRALSTIIDAAISRKVDFVIHGGDLIDKPRPPTAAWRCLLQELPRLREAGIPFIATVGSHDRPDSYFDKTGGDVLEILEDKLGLVKRLDTDHDSSHTLQLSSGSRVSVYGVGDHGSEQEAELKKLKLSMNPDSDFKILIMHTSVTNTRNITGPLVRTETIQEFISRTNVDYVALGHNHRRWENRDMGIFNPGSPEITSFADAPTMKYASHGADLIEETALSQNIEHGYYLTEVSGDAVRTQFIPITTRDVKNIQIHFANAQAAEVTEATKVAISKNTSNSSIIRPILKGTLHPSSSKADIDLQQILELREKLLYLEYPLTDLGEPDSHPRLGQESDISRLMIEYIESRLGRPAKDIATIATKLLALYTERKPTTDQEALNVIDEWKLNDKTA